MAIDMPRTLHDGSNIPQRISEKLVRVHPWAPWIAAILAGIAVILVAWHFIGELFAPKKKPPPAPPVKVATVQRRDVSVMANTIGTVVSPAMVQVTAQVTGK